MSSSLTELLSPRVAVGADTPALIYGERRLSHGDLAEESRRVAQGFVELGIGPGDRVALWLPNVPAWLACFFACAQIGAVVVTVNTRFKSSEVSDIVGRSGAKLLVFWPGFRKIDFAGILSDIPPGALAGLTSIVAYDESPEAPALPTLLGLPVKHYHDLARRPECPAQGAAPDSGCIIFTTSGTTRAPKFVMHAQRSIAHHASAMAGAFGFDAKDTAVLLTIPMCGVMGLCMATAALAAGRPLILLPTFEARAAAQAIRDHRITHFPAVGDIVAQLLATTTEAVPFPSVRMVIGARGGQAAPAQARGLTLMGTYGMSEVQALLSRHPHDAPPAERELGGGTLIAPEGRVRARDPETGSILGHGVRGELEFHVPSMMSEYYANPAATAAAFTADGYLKSGDLGYTTGDNSFIFVARMGDVMRLAGFLVNPLEIEAVLDEHPAVLTSQVVGIEGPRGTRPVAFVIAREGATVDASALIAHCAQRIAKYKVPEHILPIEAFPVTPSANGNKIQKARLRDIANAALNQETAREP
jgi:fatty-acyl-CoA synthase